MPFRRRLLRNGIDAGGNRHKHTGETVLPFRRTVSLSLRQLPPRSRRPSHGFCKHPSPSVAGRTYKFPAARDKPARHDLRTADEPRPPALRKRKSRLPPKTQLRSNGKNIWSKEEKQQKEDARGGTGHPLFFICRTAFLPARKRSARAPSPSHRTIRSPVRAWRWPLS